MVGILKNPPCETAVKNDIRQDVGGRAPVLIMVAHRVSGRLFPCMTGLWYIEESCQPP